MPRRLTRPDVWPFTAASSAAVCLPARLSPSLDFRICTRVARYGTLSRDSNRKTPQMAVLTTPYASIAGRAGSSARFYHADCLDVFAELEPRSVDVIVTSPPYNIGVKYRSYEDDMPRTEYLNWTDRWMRSAAKAMTPGGSFFLNVGAKPTDPWIPLEVAQVAKVFLPELHGLVVLVVGELEALARALNERPSALVRAAVRAEFAAVTGLPGRLRASHFRHCAVAWG